MAAPLRNHDSSDSDDSSGDNDLSTANNRGSAQIQASSSSQVGVGSQGRKVERTWRLEQGEMRVIGMIFFYGIFLTLCAQCNGIF